jgi:hypothetical protein
VAADLRLLAQINGAGKVKRVFKLEEAIEDRRRFLGKMAMAITAALF